MTVIITGGTGLLGRYLERELIKRNIKYKILSRTPRGNQILCDYSFRMLNELLKSGNILIHLAGSRIPGDSLKDFEQEQIILKNILKIANSYNYKKSFLHHLYLYIQEKNFYRGEKIKCRT